MIRVLPFFAGVMNIFANSKCFDIADGVGSTSILSGHFDSTIKVWDTRASREPKNVVKVDGHVTSLTLGTGEYGAAISGGDGEPIVSVQLNFYRLL